MSWKGPPFFDILQQNGCLKTPQNPSLSVFGTMRLTGDIVLSVFSFFVFWEIFGWARWVFPGLTRTPSCIFRNCKIGEILAILSFCIFRKLNFLKFSGAPTYTVPSLLTIIKVLNNSKTWNSHIMKKIHYFCNSSRSNRSMLPACAKFIDSFFSVGAFLLSCISFCFVFFSEIRSLNKNSKTTF